MVNRQPEVPTSSSDERFQKLTEMAHVIDTENWEQGHKLLEKWNSNNSETDELNNQTDDRSRGSGRRET